MSLGTILLIILVIILLGGFSGLGGGPFYGTGYYGGRWAWLSNRYSAYFGSSGKALKCFALIVINFGAVMLKGP